jgi:hypothetical protein
MPHLSTSGYIGPEHDGEIGTAETPEVVMACAFCGSSCTVDAFLLCCISRIDVSMYDACHHETHSGHSSYICMGHSKLNMGVALK